ncbi:DUF58 domain-containing protein [Oceanirhabdus sp. W0125-5]|uniref:DUF58 domain-containing protein n=1 Tax=Oceanirhabdus sp. W0125-5 TaxID=2999116 RepID=UPI0022F30D0E|nr:DUF58 domain-containing protein [Oceanirhabdus sp. W0125-5]WBW98795.1 DUF58 domain-containing protein [Oceanirhabdus sp. W0125-5]
MKRVNIEKNKERVNFKFFFATLIMFLFAYFMGGELPYSLFYTMVCIIVFSLWYVYNAKKKLSCFVDLNIKRTIINEKVIVNQTICSDTRTPLVNVLIKSFQFNTVNGANKEVRLFLGEKGAERIKQEVAFKYRGVYKIGEIEYEISDPFGIFKVKKKEVGEGEIHVYPVIYEIFEEINTRSKYLDAYILSKNGIEDRNLIKDIRKYRPGDDIKRIHWKVSAKYDTLLVKNYEKVEGNEVFLFINMNKENMENLEEEERMVDFSMSLMYNFLKEEIRCNISINSLEEKEFYLENKTVFDETAEFFKNTKSDGEEEFDEFINNKINKVPFRGWIGVITIKVDEKLKNSLINLKDNGYKVTLFHCDSNEKNIKLLRTFGIETMEYQTFIEKKETEECKRVYNY